MNRNDDYDEISQGQQGQYDSGQFDSSQQGQGQGQGGMGRQQGGRMPKSQFPGGSDDTFQQGDDTGTGDSWNTSQQQKGQSGGYGSRQTGGQDYDPNQGVGQYEEDDSSRRQTQKSGLLQGQEPSGRKSGRSQEGQSYMDEPAGEGFVMQGENQPSGGQDEFGGYRQ